MRQLLNNPDNLWGKWLKLALWKQIILAFVLLGLICYLPLYELQQQYHRQQQAQQNLTQIQTQLEHKKRLVNSLNQQYEQHQLNPELARLVLPINQSVKQLGAPLNFQLNQWFFEQKPQLSLQVQGSFLNLKHFLTALLSQHRNLGLISLQIQQSEQAEYSIEGEILLQLQTVKEQQ